MYIYIKTANERFVSLKKKKSAFYAAHLGQ